MPQAILAREIPAHVHLLQSGAIPIVLGATVTSGFRSSPTRVVDGTGGSAIIHPLLKLKSLVNSRILLPVPLLHIL